MWRGPVVANKKEASAKAKAKIYTIHSKLIAIAAERGADPKENNPLADAISVAKKAWVTADVIDRAIKRGAGIDTDGKKVEEVLYEGYLPGGVAVILRALTDNRNRTAPNVRHLFSAHGGGLGETGSVSNYLFDLVGRIVISTLGDIEAFELALLETSARDYHLDGSGATVDTDRWDLAEVARSLRGAGYEIESTGFHYIPKNYTEVTDFSVALQIYSFLESAEDDEDIEIVWNNADISDELWWEVASHVEKHRFRT